MATIYHKNLLSNPALISMPLIGLVLTLVVLMTALGGECRRGAPGLPGFLCTTGRLSDRMQVRGRRGVAHPAINSSGPAVDGCFP